MRPALTRQEERRIQAKIRILDYCNDPRGFNEITDFARKERIYSRVKIKEILDELLQDKSLDVRKGNLGLKDECQTNRMGQSEIERAKKLLKGEISGVIPIAPFTLSLTFDTKDLPPGIVSEAMFRSQKEVLEDPQKSKELGTLIGSIVMSYVQQNMREDAVTKGAFMADGKFTLVTVFSRGESIRFRDIVNSGRLQKGSETFQLSNLLYMLGTRALLEIYKSHEHGSFEPKTTAATFVGLELNEDGTFKHQLAELNTVITMKKMQEEIETRIRILSSLSP